MKTRKVLEGCSKECLDSLEAKLVASEERRNRKKAADQAEEEEEEEEEQKDQASSGKKKLGWYVSTLRFSVVKHHNFM